MALHDYARKRDFRRTPEPAGGAQGDGRPMFVVQLHHASRRHYDFRLQVGDALMSWAVPKGPSYDPAVKRMAVQVEDHPLDYAAFEGEIPRGQYGGGHVALFDRGTWSSEADVAAQLEKGHLQFTLFGERLKGRWHLIRTAKPARQPQWLLVKADDAYAGKLEADDLLDGVAPAPAGDIRRAGAGKPDKAGLRSIQRAHGDGGDWKERALALEGSRQATLTMAPHELQLARLVDAPPPGDDWLHEIKWDGYRLLALRKGSEVRVFSRNGLPWEHKLPEVVEALLRLDATNVALDGELIAGRGTREDFNLLQRILSGQAHGATAFVAFDLLHVDGIDLTGCALQARKALLADMLRNPPPYLSLSTHVAGNGALAFDEAVAAGFEGTVSKRADARYHPGRSDQWRKAKALSSEEFAVVGYTPPKGSRRGIGALLLARADGDGQWHYAGRVGSGMDEALLQSFGHRFQGQGTKTPTVQVPEHDTDLRAARWVPPELVVEAFVRGTGSSGLLRQASFKALREDKTPADLLAANREEAPPVENKGKRGRGTGKAARTLPDISSGDKLLYRKAGISKQQVVDYHLAVMDWLLPEIAGRPLSVIRCPGGIDAQCFFQKHATAGMELVRLVPLAESSGGSDDYIVVDDAAAVIELVQFNTLEFHPWGARARSPDLADFLVFDLDPGDAVAWTDVRASARQVRDLLAKAGLQSFVRTSGGKGLHVVVPLRPAVPWEQAKPFARAFAESMVAMDPLRHVASASKRLRRGKVFVDWLRNGRGATSIASFSLRARPGAPVAMPLRWSELGRIKAGNAYDIASAPRRLARLKGHPWGDWMALRQSLPSFD
ncbi:MAG: DNA ligase D [Pseudoxanthomonas suwonensis]|nr:DNA ligase D [Pseudoxanthomonas suwonensis]